MTDEAEVEAPPHAPPLWGQATFRRAEDGAADFEAQIKVSGEGVRIEAAIFLKRGEALTGPDGQAWVVAEVQTRADSGYSWARLAAPAAAEQQALNQIGPEPEPETRTPRAKKPKVNDAEPSPDAPPSGSDEPQD